MNPIFIDFPMSRNCIPDLSRLIVAKLSLRQGIRYPLWVVLFVVGFSGSVMAAPPYDSLTIGGQHVCAIDRASNLECQTYSAFDRLLPKGDTGAFKTVVAGDTHTCGIRLDESVACWGDNGFGQLDIPRLSLPLQDIDAGQNHTCVIDATGDVQCWGLDDNQRLELPYPDRNFTGISVHNGYGCVIDDEMLAHCATVLTALNNTHAPVGLDQVVQIEAFSNEIDTYNLACAVDVNGEVECWGTTAFTPVVAPVFNDGPYSDVAIGETVACAVRQRGSLDCQVYRRGSNGAADVVANAPDSSDQLSVEAGSRGLFCTLNSAGEARCWSRSTTRARLFGGDISFPAPPLRVSVYSETTVELLWGGNGVFPSFGSRYEILRNGEVLTTTSNGSSFIDSTLLPGVDYEYQLVLVSGEGRRSELSNAVTVNSSDFTNPGPAAGYTPPSRPQTPDGLRAEVYWGNTVELFWDRDFSRVRGYEIRRDGSYIGFTDGTSFLDSPNATQKPDYDVIAVDRDGQILGFSSLEVDLGAGVAAGAGR